MNCVLVLALVALALPALEARVAPQIIGGRDAKVGEFPYQGSLQRRTRLLTGEEVYAGHECGCTLVSDVWLVTAAHCMGRGTKDLYVVMGLHKRGDKTLGKPEGYYINQIFVNPEWNTRTLRNDIAMVQLREKVNMNEFVKTIAMAPAGAKYVGKQCTITGWGVTQQGGRDQAKVLQAAKVEVVSEEDCKLQFNLVSYKSQICAHEAFESGACNGDSGGPMVCEGKLVGVVSFGPRGCYTNVPSVFTRVSAFRTWIKITSGL